MTSEVDICKLALSHIRAGSINSLDENSLQAQQCKLMYPLLRDQMIESAPWQFAHRVKALSLLTDNLFNWAYVYQYPSECLKINRLLLNFEEVQAGDSTIASRFYDRGLPIPDMDAQVEYKIYNIDGNKVIASNETELRVDYVTRVTDVNLFDNQFILGLSHLLAAELAVPLVGVKEGRQMKSDEYQLYQAFINSAVAADMNEQYTPTPDSEFITVRN